MKKKLLSLILCVSFFSPALMSQNVAIAPGVESITTDGLLNEAGWIIDKPVSKVVFGTPGIDLNEAYFGVAYNAEYLYIGLDVLDSILTPYEMGEVFIDGNNNGGAYGESDLHLRFAGPFIQVVYPDSIEGILLGFAIKPLGNGFTAELGIPWAELGITPVPGEQIGFDLILSDGDSGLGVDYMMAWNGGLENYAGTSSFGDLIFQPENEVIAPKSDYITVDGVLIESDWKIDQLVNLPAFGTPGDDPNTSYFGVAYNANYLYVGLDVIDTILTQFEMGEVFIDGNNNGGLYDASDLHLRFAGPYVQVIYPDTILGVLLGFSIRPTGFGYYAELAIPWAELGITPVPGEQIGFDLILSDGDSGLGVDYMMAWNGGLENYAGTSSFGDLIFQPENEVTAPKSDYITVDGVLIESDWKIDQLVNLPAFGTPGDDPNTSYFGVAYNANFLYVGLDVIDTMLTQFEMGEVFIDGNNNGGLYDASDLHLRFAGPYVQVIYPDTILGVLLGFSIKSTGFGYYAELGIPWSELGITPVEGEQIGFDLILSDGDSGMGVDYMMAWNGGLQNYAMTSSFGDLIFGVSSFINDDKDYSNNVVLFPNPSTGNVSIQIDSDLFSGIANYHIADIAGRTVVDEQVDLGSGNTVELDAGLFTSGVYFITIRDNDGAKAIKKLIIQ